MRRASSSISGSEPGGAWRRFLRHVLGSTVACALGVYLFVVLVDPWGMLPLHLPLRRVPVSSNARFSLPAVAIGQQFDAAVIGSSTSRLLPPARLDAIFGARFSNLAMNAATWPEQAAMLSLFARSHARPRAVMVGLDRSWCNPDQVETLHEMPGWMYGDSRWAGYLAMFNLYAVQEATNQFRAVVGLRRKRSYGLDGYTEFLPPDRDYDYGRVLAGDLRWGPVSREPAPAGGVALPDLDALATLLAGLPADTLKLLWFPPPTREILGAEGTKVAAGWAACKARAVALSGAVANTVVLDFAFPDAITADTHNFWDKLHYRVAVRDRILADVARALRGLPDPDGDGRILADTRPRLNGVRECGRGSCVGRPAR